MPWITVTSRNGEEYKIPEIEYNIRFKELGFTVKHEEVVADENPQPQLETPRRGRPPKKEKKDE